MAETLTQRRRLLRAQASAEPAPAFASRRGPLFTLSAAAAPLEKPSVAQIVLKRPLALLSLLPNELSMFIAGGVAGAIAKTTTAPLDRVRSGRVWRVWRRLGSGGGEAAASGPGVALCGG